MTVFSFVWQSKLARTDSFSDFCGGKSVFHVSSQSPNIKEIQVNLSALFNKQ